MSRRARRRPPVPSSTSGKPRRLPHAVALRGIGRGKQQFVIIASQFNRSITRALIRGATQALRRAGVSDHQIDVRWVPGAFELPIACAQAARSHPRPQAIIAVGVLLRGETPQYEVLAHAVAQGLMQVSVNERLPVTFGVIVARTLAQAKARAGGAMGNRGADAALAALAVLRLLEKVKQRSLNL